MPYDCESDAANIQDNLNCVHTGSVVVFLPEIDSTNNLIKAYLANGADEGLVAVAESQTGGRGRMGRIWHSPPETGVYLSVLLKPPVGPNHLPLFTLLAGVTAVQTVNEFCPHPASLKWPNDILINGKKVCGLLCELVQNQGEPSGLIIGVGINVNHLPDQFPENLKNIATSPDMLQPDAFPDWGPQVKQVSDELDLWRRALPPETLHTTKASWQVDERTLIELYLIWYNTGVMDMIANVDEGLNLILSDVMEEMLEEAGYEI